MLNREIISPCTLCEKLWRSCAPDVRIVSLAQAVFQLSGRRTRAVLLRHILATFPFDAPMFDYFISDRFVQLLTPSCKCHYRLCALIKPRHLQFCIIIRFYFRLFFFLSHPYLVFVVLI